MKWLSRLFGKKILERDLDRELQFHFNQMLADLIEQGVPPVEARRRVVLEFGGFAQVKEECRDARGTRLIEDVILDVKYALRALRQNPGFAVVAVLSLALGLGANTALFSVVDAVMMKNLPVRDPDQLRIVMWEQGQFHPPEHSGYSLRDDHGRFVDGSFAYPTYLAFRDHVPQFSDVMACAPESFTVTASGTSDVANGYYVSGSYLTGLGAVPLLGRTIQPHDDAAGEPGVVVLTERYWEMRFSRDASVVGRAIRINNLPVTVVGVMPRAFQGTNPGQQLDVMVPLSMISATPAAFYSLSDHNNWWVQVFGRIKTGVTDAAATEAARAVLARQIETYHATKGVPQIVLEPGARGVGRLRASLHSTLAVLSWTTGIVLLIACVNMANLLLARAAARTREVAIRVSIGAGRGRLIRQMLTESLLLSSIGGAVGLTLAEPLRRFLMRLLSKGTLGLDARLDLRSLGFALAAALITGLLFGILPAMRSSRLDVISRLKDGGAAAAGRSARQLTGRLLVSGQIALSLLLLTGAGLFVRTLQQLGSVDLGYRADNLLLFETDPGRSGYKGAAVDRIGNELVGRMSAIPGVASAGMSHQRLIDGSVSNGGVYFPGSQKENPTWYLYCSDSFLQTMSIPLVLGRGLRSGEPDDRVGEAVVNEAFVKLYLPGEIPLGRKFTQDGPTGTLFAITGVVKDAHYESVRGEAHPTAYLPYRFRYPGITQMSFVVRTPLAPGLMGRAVRHAVASVNETLPVAEMRTEREQIDRSLGTERLFASLVSAFGALAALLSAIGLYGVMAYSVARRTAEIGIRVALGADRRNVQWLVVRESLLMVVIGIAVGVPAAVAFTNLVRSMLYGVSAADPFSFLVAIAAMILVAGLAAWIPARRASQVDPLAALHHH